MWRNELRELQYPAFSTIGDMEDHALKPLMFSYDQLRNDMKNCCLYCSLFPVDFAMHGVELIECWRAARTHWGSNGSKDSLLPSSTIILINLEGFI